MKNFKIKNLKLKTGQLKTTLLLFFCLIVLFVASFSVIAAGAADFVPEIVASENGANFYWSDIGANDSGLTAIFSNSRLFTKTGTGWKKNLVNPAPTYAYCGTVLVDSTGTTHVFYSGNYSGSGPLLHAAFNPDLPDGVSSPSAESVGTGCINSAVEDVDGNIHLVYVSGSLYYRVRSGGTWSPPQQIYPSGSSYAFFDAIALRLGSDGRTLHLAAQQTSSGASVPKGLYYGTKAQDGAWTFETAVPNIQSYNRVLSLAVDGQSPYLLYYEYISTSDSRVKMARRNADGTWTLEYLFTGAKGGIQGMDADALNGTLYVVFSAGSGSSDDNRPWMIKKILPAGTPESQAIAERLGYADSPLESAHPAITVGAGRPSASYTYNRWRVKAVMDLSNSVPRVNAGPDKSASIGSLVTLSGTASDLDNDALTVSWNIEDPSGLVTTQTGYAASFSTNSQGFYVATFKALDERGIILPKN